MAILLVLGLGVWMALSQGSSVLGSVSKVIQGNREILLLDDALRRELGSIRFPYWLGAPPPAVEIPEKQSGSPLAIPFLDGIAGNSLRMELKGRKVHLTRIEGTSETLVGSFGPFDAVSWESAPGSPGKSSGIRVSVRPEGRPAVTLFVSFGSNPFYYGGRQ